MATNGFKQHSIKRLQTSRTEMWTFLLLEGEALKVRATHAKPDCMIEKSDNSDFCLLILIAAVQIGTKFMNIWMYVIRMMENALDACEIPCDDEICHDDAIHSWDQAVAFYSGSLEDDGVLFFAFADVMCKVFRSCGIDGSLRVGTSYTNNKVIKEFKDGQKYILQRKCDKARASKEEIVKVMAVPLIQATLYTAYVQIHPQSQNDGDGSMTDRVRSSSFAATVLPIVHDCDANDAATIYEKLRIDPSNPQKSEADFLAVKKAFEKNYQCMGVTCEAVGGVWLGGEYGTGAEPCDEKVSMDTSTTNAFVFVSLGVLMLLGFGVFSIFLDHRSRRRHSEETAKQHQTAADILEAFEDDIRLPNID